MKHLGFASVSAVNQYLRYAKSRKLNITRLVQRSGISPTVLEQQHGRIKGDQFERLLLALVEASQDPLMGLNSSLYVGPQSYNTLGMIAMNCHSLGEAIERTPPFERLVGDMGTTHIQKTDKDLTLKWLCAYQEAKVRPHMVDNVLASWTMFARWLSQSQAHALRVSLQREKPDDASNQTYRRFFGCDVIYGASQDSITMSTELLALPIKRNHQGDLSILEGHARSQLSTLQVEGESFSDSVRRSIRAHLQLGSVSKSLIAQEFNLCERTIQRRLSADQQSYQALLDEARYERAQELLEIEQLTFEEIAYNLGFSDERCFYRSFKRWSGLSPGNYLKKQRASASKSENN